MIQSLRNISTSSSTLSFVTLIYLSLLLHTTLLPSYVHLFLLHTISSCHSSLHPPPLPLHFLLSLFTTSISSSSSSSSLSPLVTLHYIHLLLLLLLRTISSCHSSLHPPPPPPPLPYHLFLSLSTSSTSSFSTPSPLVTQLRPLPPAHMSFAI
ncbi:hypothetical protein E2C01_043966 [Portunus trituberculatus]|uniref:Uncharacterized protein n=1 Tax=Portunus trituberculatus TaxID=210409 RepID=A0A5B7G0X9_PORTR|nr:hypothetical protein [Portunus trituberculatus]